MLHFFKSKPILKDLIPNDYTDIHSHLLPGIDDGSQNINDTIGLIKSLKDIGISQCITTPHIMESVWENTPDIINEKLASTIKSLEKEGFNMPLKAAAEYMMDANFMTLFKNEPLLTLKDNYILVEMSYLNAPIQLSDIIFELQVAGYKPVLAHPERYNFFHHNFKNYEKLKQQGCLFQLNLLSTIGYYGLEVAKTAEKLLQNGMIDFVGSDVHHQKHIEGFYKKVLYKNIAPLKEAISNNSLFSF